MAWTSVRIEENGQLLRLSGDEAEARFHAIWLRDNALDPATRDAGNGQRLITLGDIPAGVSIKDARIGEGQLHATFSPENKTCAWPLRWLAAHCYDRPTSKDAGWTEPATPAYAAPAF